MKISRFTQLGCVCMISAATMCQAQDYVATLMAEHEVAAFDDGQIVRITLSAWIDKGYADLFASTNFNVIVHSVEPVDWRALVTRGALMIYEPPGTFRNVQLGQLHFPPIGAFGDETNPLPIFELTFFTRDLSPRQLRVEMPVITSFNVYRDSASIDVTQLEPGQFPDQLVWHFPIGTPCRADIDGDGELTIFDFLEFQNLFAAGDPAADFDGDGELTIFDFLAFQNEFALGCD